MFPFIARSRGSCLELGVHVPVYNEEPMFPFIARIDVKRGVDVPVYSDQSMFPFIARRSRSSHYIAMR
jgi:hypothetical protein